MQNNKTFIVYLDDNDVMKKGYVDMMECNQNFVKFATDRNIITIPFSRVIKMKEGLENGSM